MSQEASADYDELTKVVSDIDSASAATERQMIKIDMSSLFAANQPQKVRYADLLGIIEGVESRRAIFGGQRVQQAAPAEESRGAKTPFEQQVEQAIGPEAAAPAELQVPATPAALKGIRIKRVNFKELVLPNLSIPDQVSELERIIEGAREGVFDQGHLDVVKQEVYGLYYFIELQRRQITKEKKKLNSLEQSMWTLRDQRLVDTIAAIKQGSVGANVS